MSRPVDVAGELSRPPVCDQPGRGGRRAELSSSTYDPRPAAVDPRAALTGDVVIFPEAGTNVVCELSIPEGGRATTSSPAARWSCGPRSTTTRLAPCPLEVQAAASRWEPDGRLTHWSSTQTPHMVKGASGGLRPPGRQVRVIAPDVGGGFGAKFGSYPEALLLPWIARRLAGPSGGRDALREHGGPGARPGPAPGGRAGRHPRRPGPGLPAHRRAGQRRLSPHRRGAAGFTALMTSGVYAIPRVEFSSRSWSPPRTRSWPTGVRAARRPAPPSSGPWISTRRRSVRTPPRSAAATSSPPTSSRYHRRRHLLRLGRLRAGARSPPRAADYERLRKEQPSGGPRRSRQIGIGVATYVEITSPVPGGEFGAVEITSRGGRWCAPDRPPRPGPRHRLRHAGRRVSRAAMEAVDVATATPTPCRPASARSAPAPCNSAGRPSAWPRSRSWNRPGSWPPSCWRPIPTTSSSPRHLPRGRYPGRRPELGRGGGRRGADGLAAELTYEERGPTFPFGAHLAVVSVDTDTGGVELVRFVAVDDAGKILNPMLAEGRCTAASPRAWPRPSTRSSATTTTATPHHQPGRLRLRLRRRAAVLRAVACETPPTATNWAPRGSASRGHRLHTGGVERRGRRPLAPRRDAPRHPHDTERIWRAVAAARTT